MKKLFFISAIILGLTSIVYSQDDPVYLTAMQESITKISSCKKSVDYLNTINQFQRIADMNKKEWLPLYWSAYTYTLASYSLEETNEKDQYLLKAETLIEEIEKHKNDDEVLVLKAFVAQSRMNVDPQNRFTTYGSKANLLLEQAMKINPENPRIYNLKGRSIFYTPEQFGGGKKAAQPLLEIAVNKYEVFKPLTVIHPNWGEDYTLDLYTQCKVEN